MAETVVGLVTALEVVAGVLVPDMGPSQHGVRVGEIGEVVEVDDCQGHYMVSFAAPVLDLAHAVGEGWGLEEVLVDHMDWAVEAVG